MVTYAESTRACNLAEARNRQTEKAKFSKNSEAKNAILDSLANQIGLRDFSLASKNSAPVQFMISISDPNLSEAEKSSDKNEQGKFINKMFDENREFFHSGYFSAGPSVSLLISARIVHSAKTCDNFSLQKYKNFIRTLQDRVDREIKSRSSTKDWKEECKTLKKLIPAIKEQINIIGSQKSEEFYSNDNSDWTLFSSKVLPR